MFKEVSIEYTNCLHGRPSATLHLPGTVAGAAPTLAGAVFVWGWRSGYYARPDGPVHHQPIVYRGDVTPGVCARREAADTIVPLSLRWSRP